MCPHTYFQVGTTLALNCNPSCPCRDINAILRLFTDVIHLQFYLENNESRVRCTFCLRVCVMLNKQRHLKIT